MTQQQHPDYEVIIVGYGPVGATLANLLGLRGIRTLVFERGDTIYGLPRAGTCDDEAMRIWQSIGLAPLLMTRFLPQKLVQFLDAAGKPFLELRRESFGYGYPGVILLYQPLLEQTLRDGVGRFGSVDVRLEHPVETVEEVGDVVAVSGRDAAGTPFRTTARYVVA